MVEQSTTPAARVGQAHPDEAESLKPLVRDLFAERDLAYQALKIKTLELEKLKLQLAKLRRMQFGRSSEKLAREVAPLELAIEEIETSEAAVAEPAPMATADPAEAGETAAVDDRPRKPARRSLPPPLQRETVMHHPSATCPDGGGESRLLGEDRSEVLEYVPGHFKIIEHVRPKMSCRACETIRQAPAPVLPIERGRPGPGLLAHVLTSKYCDHLPLYRQAEIYARDGVDLSRSTLAGWVGRAAFELRPLVEAVAAHVLAADVIHGDDTPVPVLAPGTGKTATGRLWVYVRDERPWASPVPPAVLYRYSPDRKGVHPRSHLDGFPGILQADGYAGFNELYKSGAVTEVAALPMSGASSSTSMPPTAPRSRKPRSIASALSTASRKKRVTCRRTAAAPSGKAAPARCSTISKPGSRRPCRGFPARASLPAPSATP